jgi:type IV pilus assembly protein PilM
MGFFKKTAKPRLACEITPFSVIAARATRDRNGVDLYTARKLASNTVNPSLTTDNIINPGGLRDAITGALASLSGRNRDVIAILPDAAVRVMLLDFDTLPEKQSEADPLIRFRLRKSLPFDVDSAALSFQSRHDSNGVKVLAAVVPSAVLAGYEAAFRAAGYEPGIILSSTLATLSMVETHTPTLLVRADGPFITMVVVDANDVLLYRTLDTPTSSADVAEAVYPSIVFYEDNYSSKLQRILLAGTANLSEIASALYAQTEIRAEQVDSSVAVGEVGETLSGEPLAPSSIAGIAGVLVN